MRAKQLKADDRIKGEMINGEVLTGIVEYVLDTAFFLKGRTLGIKFDDLKNIEIVEG